MNEFVGRLPPIGALAWLHCDRISQGLTNPDRDDASIDLEILGYYALVKGKIDQAAKKPKTFDEDWRATELELEGLKKSGDYSDAERLRIRLRQFELLTTACVQISLFDVAQVPTDQWRTA